MADVVDLGPAAVVDLSGGYFEHRGGVGGMTVVLVNRDSTPLRVRAGVELLSDGAVREVVQLVDADAVVWAIQWYLTR